MVMTNEDTLRALDWCGDRLTKFTPTRAPTDRRVDSMQEAMEHLAFMTNEAKEQLLNDKGQKANRWLGFIQGVLWFAGLVTIEEMKTLNRPEADAIDAVDVHQRLVTSGRLSSKHPNTSNAPGVALTDNRRWSQLSNRAKREVIGWLKDRCVDEWDTYLGKLIGAAIYRLEVEEMQADEEPFRKWQDELHELQISKLRIHQLENAAWYALRDLRRVIDGEKVDLSFSRAALEGVVIQMGAHAESRDDEVEETTP